MNNKYAAKLVDNELIVFKDECVGYYGLESKAIAFFQRLTDKELQENLVFDSGWDANSGIRYNKPFGPGNWSTTFFPYDDMSISFFFPGQEYRDAFQNNFKNIRSYYDRPKS